MPDISRTRFCRPNRAEPVDPRGALPERIRPHLAPEAHGIPRPHPNRTAMQRIHSAPVMPPAWPAAHDPKPPTPKVRIELGAKYKRNLALLCPESAVNFEWRISGLQSTTGRPYMCTRSIRALQGSSGKIRYAMDPTGTLLVAKEVRTEAAWARGAAQHKRMSTTMMRRADVAREIRLMQLIEPSLKVHACIDVAGKVYIMMDAMGGDFWSLMTGGWSARCHLVRTMMTEMARSLRRCHAHGYIHHDFKIENVLWRDDGTYVLADFGLSRRHAAIQSQRLPVGGINDVSRNGRMHWAGPPATHPAPEMCLLDGATHRVRYDYRIDTWALGMAFMLSYISADQSPFRLWHVWLTFGDYDALAPHIAQYTAWHRRVVQEDGRLNAKQLYKKPSDPRAPCPYNAFFRPVFEVDPKLLAFVLRFMLHPAPQARASLTQVEAFCRDLKETTPEPVVQAGRKLFANHLIHADGRPKSAKCALRSVFAQVHGLEAQIEALRLSGLALFDETDAQDSQGPKH